MRIVQCPQCQAKNRRPKCGACDREIADPPVIHFAWALYDRRKSVGIAFLISMLALFLLRPWDPANLSECREQAARTARSNDAMHILLNLCSSKFPDTH